MCPGSTLYKTPPVPVGSALIPKILHMPSKLCGPREASEGHQGHPTLWASAWGEQRVTATQRCPEPAAQRQPKPPAFRGPRPSLCHGGQVPARPGNTLTSSCSPRMSMNFLWWSWMYSGTSSLHGIQWFRLESKWKSYKVGRWPSGKHGCVTEQTRGPWVCPAHVWNEPVHWTEAALAPSHTPPPGRGCVP